MKFTLAIALVASIVGVQAVPHPQITALPVRCPVKSCGVATKTVPPQICPAVLCPTAPVACPLIIAVTQVPCCCKTETIKTSTVTAPCCTTRCVIPTETLYTGCPTPTITKEPSVATVWVTETVGACVP
ncbi:hypothetical protein H072_7552 [Dactylellina haptotyla CBS 200.50]|uniref:Uncharacterized protein n=1 Tax=Dactylellina haptotyla (strain CBS 200.50) TaxID=1284197 RepID=S8BTS0_DACHA|nr:hypothetical protein H072_7552 [Dactylellina haptotyla CBS 200.50]